MANTLQAIQFYAQMLAQAARFADTTALFQALGGGWWNHADASADLIALPR